jgi:hypothetical protein
MKLKEGYKLIVLDEGMETGCNNGQYPEWILTDEKGNIVESGFTCACGRGCSDTDCIRDDWNFHDTCIEQYREA